MPAEFELRRVTEQERLEIEDLNEDAHKLRRVEHAFQLLPYNTKIDVAERAITDAAGIGIHYKTTIVLTR